MTEADDVRTELITIIGDEFNEAGITNTVVDPAPLEGCGYSPAQLLVPLGDGRSADAPVVQIYFLPWLENPPAVQYIVFLDHEIAESAGPDLARFVALLNSNLTVTGFEINEHLGQVVFRHTHAVTASVVDPGVIAWSLTMVRAAVEHFGPLVEYMAKGGAYDEAVEALGSAVDRLPTG